LGQAVILQRLDGWERRLNDFIEARRHLPFVWGSNDCVTFASGALEAITGHCIWAPVWTNEDEALRALVPLRGLEAAATAILGQPHDNWRLMRRGDVAMVEQENGRNALMVCAGTDLVGPGLEALQLKPLSAALKVWRVG